MPRCSSYHFAAVVDPTAFLLGFAGVFVDYSTASVGHSAPSAVDSVDLVPSVSGCH